MDTLRDRLADLADGAPTGGAPPAEIWARGKRTQALQAAALASCLLVVIAVGGRLGVRLLDRQPDVLLGPGGASGITLPIDYPAGQELPNLGDNPGPLAAVWLAPREPYTLDDDDAGLAPAAVGLVAETGKFGTLPIDLYNARYEAPDASLALSPDGRRVAYFAPPRAPEPADPECAGGLVVRDLVTGEEYSPAFDFPIRCGATWVDATRLVGPPLTGSDWAGWAWDAQEPDTAPSEVTPYPYLEDLDLPATITAGDPPWSCRNPLIRARTGEVVEGRPVLQGAAVQSVLCDTLAVIDSEIVLGHLRSGPPDDPTRAVVAVDVRDAADFPFDDPALRRVVVRANAPYPVTFATDLIAEALEADGDSS